MPPRWQILPTPQPPKPHFNTIDDLYKGFAFRDAGSIALIRELDALDAYENKRRGDLAKEKEFWEKADYYEAKTTWERGHGYIDGVDWYYTEEYAGLHDIDRWIKREDQLVSEEAHVKIYRMIAEARARKNEAAYGCSWWGMEQDKIQKEKEIKAEGHYQMIVAKKEHEERVRRERRFKIPTFGLTSSSVSGASGFLLTLLGLLLGLLWSVARGLAWVAVLVAKTAATTFWNRYMGYDVPATEQRSDNNILNAQFQTELFDPSDSQQQNQYQHRRQYTGETSWTGSAFSLLGSILHAIYHLIIATIYSLYRLLENSLRAFWRFVRENGSTCLLLLVVVLLVFNPWRPHPARTYAQNQLIRQIPLAASPPLPRPSRFIPPEANFPSQYPRPTVPPSPLAPTPTRAFVPKAPKATRGPVVSLSSRQTRQIFAILGLETDVE